MFKGIINGVVHAAQKVTEVASSAYRSVKTFVLPAAGLGLVAASSAMAQTTGDTTIADTTGSLTTGFGLIKTLIVSVVTFGLIIGYVKMLRRK